MDEPLNIMQNERSQTQRTIYSTICDNISFVLNVQNRQIYMIWLGLREGRLGGES